MGLACLRSTRARAMPASGQGFQSHCQPGYTGLSWLRLLRLSPSLVRNKIYVQQQAAPVCKPVRCSLSVA